MTTQARDTVSGVWYLEMCLFGLSYPLLLLHTGTGAWNVD